MPTEDDYLVYTYNRFQACRYGLAGKLIDAVTGRQVLLKDDVLETIARIVSSAIAGLYADMARGMSSGAV